MKKILLISTNADEAGAPRHVEFIVNLLNKDVDFYCVFGSKGPVFQRLDRLLPNKVLELVGMESSINLLKDLGIFMKFLKMVQEIKPEIIHCHSAKAGILGRLLSFFLNVKVIYTIHGWPWREFNGFKYKLIIYIEKFLIKYSKCSYIGVAECLRKEALDVGIDLGLSDFVVIHNSVLQHEPEEENVIYPEDEFIIMPARVSAAKNHYLLAEAYDMSEFEGNLVFAGQDTDKAEFKSKIMALTPNKYHKISFLGQRSDIGRLINLSSFVCLCSHFETFPLTIVESFAVGKPVIASNVGGNKEIIDHKYNGLIAQDLEEWKESLNFLNIKSHRDTISNNSITTFNQSFHPSLSRDKFLDVYNGLS